ncbi:MAG TPA: type II toxin-antitoxin system prevent-host-death family antitoxin [Beijerinckiaceae bacterium]|nr:type II toxin-antitoxin system prevent-host-death family antitoxin [Beijerinckiaceae bacterium]
MSITILTSREFNQATGRAKKAAKHGPVFITDRGQPAHVLPSIEDYRKLAGEQVTLADALAQSNVPDFEFEAPRAGTLFRVPRIARI